MQIQTLNFPNLDLSKYHSQTQKIKHLTESYVFKNAFWYCNLGKCIVIKNNWRRSKIIRIAHIILFYGIILGYEYYLFLTLNRIIIKSIYILFAYNILGYICLIYIFYLNFNDDKICSASKINNNQFVKEMKKEYDLFILLVNIIYSLL